MTCMLYPVKLNLYVAVKGCYCWLWHVFKGDDLCCFFLNTNLNIGCFVTLCLSWILQNKRGCKLFWALCIHTSLEDNLTKDYRCIISLQPAASFMISTPHHVPLPWLLSAKKLQSRKTSDKVCKMYKIMKCLVNVNPAAGLLDPRNHSCRGHKYQLQVPHSKTDMYLYSYFPLAIQLWNSVPTGAPSAVTLPAFRSALTVWMEGHV